MSCEKVIAKKSVSLTGIISLKDLKKRRTIKSIHQTIPHSLKKFEKELSASKDDIIFKLINQKYRIIK